MGEGGINQSERYHLPVYELISVVENQDVECLLRQILNV
jgi:hypothetical protein